MGILFSNIYEKAIALFDDPKITIAYQTNIIQFDKLMYTYLQNAIPQFSNPSIIAYRLANYSTPKGILEKFTADGINNTFNLDVDFEILPNSEYMYIEGGLQVDGSIDAENHTVTFPDILPVGQEYALEQYYVGEILDDFTGIISENGGDAFVKNSVCDMLARLLVLSWTEEKKNFLLDAMNTMTNNDLKFSSNAPILKSKIEWVKHLNAELLQCRNQLDWKITADKMKHNSY